MFFRVIENETIRIILVIEIFVLVGRDVCHALPLSLTCNPHTHVEKHKPYKVHILVL